MHLCSDWLGGGLASVALLPISSWICSTVDAVLSIPGLANVSSMSFLT